MRKPGAPRGARTWSGRVGSLGLLLASLFVSALLVEAVVLLIYGEQPKFPRRVVGAPFGIRINEPGAVYRHKSADVTVWFRINRQGMRADRDYAYPKPPGVRRIVVLGDSFTAGYEVAVEDCYASVLETELKKRGQSVEVLNAGVSGFGTAEELVYLERELLKYSPDLVVVGFYSNDIVDNMRSNLFRLEGESLVEAGRSYVPAGRLGNFLNTNPFFNWLSERSNAFVLIKERATEGFKRQMVKDNVRELERAEGGGGRNEDTYERKLAIALDERIYRLARDHGAALAIVSIPTLRQKPDRLIDTFPTAFLETPRPGFTYVSGKTVLDPYVGREQLYWMRSHFHWTPFAHRKVGEALADAVVSNRLLTSARGAAGSAPTAAAASQGAPVDSERPLRHP